MKKSKLSLGLAFIVSLLALASCGENGKGDSDELWICAYDGGYGSTWIENAASDFEEKTGTKVHFDLDTSILDRIESALKDGGDYDIYFSHDIKWQNYAAEGLLASLDDVYSSTIEGTGKLLPIERLEEQMKTPKLWEQTSKSIISKLAGPKAQAVSSTTWICLSKMDGTFLPLMLN